MSHLLAVYAASYAWANECGCCMHTGFDYMSCAVQVMCTVHLIPFPTLGVLLGHFQASQCPDRHLGHPSILGQTHLPVLLGLPPQHCPSPMDSMHSQGRVPAKLATSMLHLPRIRPLGPAGHHPSHLEIHLPDGSITSEVQAL